MAATAARAQPVDGLYVGAGAGGNYRQNQNPMLQGANAGLRTDEGFVGLGSIGYGFAGSGLPLRIEVEGNYRQNHIRSISNFSPFDDGSGTNRTYGAMVNVLYDIDLSGLGITSVYPYLGAGAGYAWNNIHNGSFSLVVPGFETSSRINATDGNFAAQAIAGLSIPIAAIPGASLTAEYRFYTVAGPTSYTSISTETFNIPRLGPFSSTFSDRTKLDDSFNHSVLVGLRYAFNTAAPPPPSAPTPVPVAQPARSYLVFFDWDRAVLTTRARQIIQDAADNSTKVHYTKIEVNGYTDTSGTPQYNQGLSIRRAQAVASELVRDGVPRAAISIQGFGETHLLVPTGPGVREPQNRRVEIIIQ
jgi:outer membrane protein OmpA-like peptidoglycan-associated protein